jgi:acyl-CoA thioester hydrolase
MRVFMGRSGNDWRKGTTARRATATPARTGDVAPLPDRALPKAPGGPILSRSDWEALVEPHATTRVKVVFRDVDMLGHVNNAVYLSYLEQVRWDLWQSWFGHDGYQRMPFIVGEATVRYRRPAHIGNVLDIDVRLAAVSRRTFTLEYVYRRASDGEEIATARTILVFVDLAAGRSKDAPEEFLARARELGVEPAAG